VSSLLIASFAFCYRFVLQDKAVGGALYKYLRHQHKKYLKRGFDPMFKWSESFIDGVICILCGFIGNG
jgi:hypothetical protein